MTTADTFLVCWCLLTSCFWSAYASPSSMNSCKPFDFSGPSDVVFLIDRSQSVSKDNFAEYKKFIRSLVPAAMKIGPDDVNGNVNYSRMGVITFVADAFINLDLITDSQNIYSCELFADGGLFDTRVRYETSQTDSKHVGLLAALKKAPELLLQRPHIDRKLLFIVSDFHEFAHGAKAELKDLSSLLQSRKHSLQVFGVGGGTYFNLMTMLELFDSDNCAARSRNDWKTYVEGLPSSTAGSSGLREVTDNDLCCLMCGGSSCRCSFSSFFHPNNTICRQSPNTCVTIFPKYTWTLLLAVMVILGGVVLALAVMAGVLHWRRTRSRQNTQTMASDSSAAAVEQPRARALVLPDGPPPQHPPPPLPQHPPPRPVRQHPPPRPVRQPATTLSSFDEWCPEQTSFDEWFPEPTSFDDDYVEPSTPPPHDRDMPYGYAKTLPGSVFFSSGNHSTQRVSSHAYADMLGQRTVPRRQTLRDILNQVNSVRRNLSIWFSQR